MSFFRTITSKPWLGDSNAFDTVPGGGAATMKTKRTGLFVFIGVVTALFGLFTVAYFMRMKLGGWNVLEDPWLLWPNTAILLVSSLLMHWATRLGKRKEIQQARRVFFAGGIVGILFLVGQLMAWQELIDLGAYASVNPANAFFFLITGLHGLHLLGGVIAWGRALLMSLGRAPKGDVATSIALCDTYWHFMLLVWVGLFWLLLMT